MQKIGISNFNEAGAVLPLGKYNNGYLLGYGNETDTVFIDWEQIRLYFKSQNCVLSINTEIYQTSYGEFHEYTGSVLDLTRWVDGVWLNSVIPLSINTPEQSYSSYEEARVQVILVGLKYIIEKKQSQRLSQKRTRNLN